MACFSLTLTSIRASAAEELSEAEALELGIEAYVFGYPLVTMELTRRIMTNTVQPHGTHAPMGQFLRMREYPDAKFRDVTAPNADTLYSTAWLDLAKEPFVLSLPDMGNRFFLMPMLDGWTNVFEVPGSRTTGGKAQAFAITGPNWNGTLPASLKQLKSPTNIVWILGRTYCTGTVEDYQACHALMDQYDLRPLSAYGKPYQPTPGQLDSSIDMVTAVREQVHQLDANEYFQLLASLLKDNPPAAADANIVDRLLQIGIKPGQKFDINQLDATIAKALATVPAAAQKKIMAHFENSGVLINGWTFTTGTGVYGTDYLQRALITAIGLGANRPQDAIYPTSTADSTGKPYSGKNKYTVHFDKGQTPPVNGFWSITMYDANYFFVDNPINKFTVSPRNALQFNPDGSLDIHIQHESPGKDQEANWLPAPSGEFVLMLRMYWPKEESPSIINGTWKPPAVKLQP